MAGAPERQYVRLEKTEDLRYEDFMLWPAGRQEEKLVLRRAYCVLRYVADKRSFLGQSLP
jgi:hypothetical protein